MFDRLATDLRSREESARSLAAARKSVFDRLRGDSSGQLMISGNEMPLTCWMHKSGGRQILKAVMADYAGNRQATVTALVQPDALTDDELDDTPPARALAPIRTVPRRDAQATMAHSQPAVSTHYQTSLAMLAFPEPSCVPHAMQLYSHSHSSESQAV